jgi:hypothetical protein
LFKYEFGSEAPSTGMTEFEAKENRCNTEDLEGIISAEAAQLRFNNDVSFNEDEIETIADLLLLENYRSQDGLNTNCFDLGYISLTGDAESRSLKLMKMLDEMKYYDRECRKHSNICNGKTLIEAIMSDVTKGPYRPEPYEAPSEASLRRRLFKYEFGSEAPSTGMTEFEAKENRCNTEDLEDIISDEAALLRFYNDVSFNEDEIETIADLLLNKNNRNEDYDETNCFDLGYISLTGDAEELSLKLIEKVDEFKYYERVFKKYHWEGGRWDTLTEYVLDSSSLIEEYEAPSEDKLRRRVSKYIKARGDRW